MKAGIKKILPLLLAICILLTGCFGGGKGSDSDGKEKKSHKENGVLNISSLTPDTFNPLTTEYSSVRDFLHLAYEGLFIVKEDLTAEGVLATGYKVTNENKTYTIELKKDVKFHDGSSFTSEDVIATFDYIMLYSDYYKEMLSGVRSYSADGDFAVVINLSSPKALFVNNLDFPILPSGIKNFNSPDFKINGTGRYKYSKTNPYVSIILEKNRQWHKDDEVNIPEVCIRLLNDNETMLHCFDSGETDMITTDRARWGEFSYTGNHKTYELTSTEYMFIGFNTVNSAFSDINMRRAVAGIIDKEEVLDTVLFSHAAIADTPISSKVQFYRNDEDKKEKTDADILKNADDMKLYILFNEEDKAKESLAQYLRRELETYGIKAELSKVDYDTFANRVTSGDYHIYIGKVDLKGDCDLDFMFGESTVIPVPDKPKKKADDEENIEDSDDEEMPVTVYRTFSICDYDSEELKGIIGSINSAKDTDGMKTAYNNLRAFYEKEVFQIPLAHLNKALFVNGRIKGKPNVNLTNFYADIGNIYIEQ